MYPLQSAHHRLEIFLIFLFYLRQTGLLISSGKWKEQNDNRSFRGGENEMYQTQTKPRYSAADDELVDVLTQISVVSMRLARKLTLFAGQCQTTEGGKSNEQNERNGCDHRRTAQRRYCD
jgi:hypothetical protein